MTSPGIRYCACGTRLARDNAGPRCARCTAVEPFQAPGRYLPPEFWDHPTMRSALDSREMGEVVRAYRLHPAHGRRPLSQELVSKWVGISQAQLSRIENGPPICHLDRLIQWALVLGIPEDRLWFSLPADLTTGRAAQPLADLTDGASGDRPHSDDDVPGSDAGTLGCLAVTYLSSETEMVDALDRMAEADVNRRQALVTLPFLLTALHEPTRNWLLSALTHSAPRDGGAQVSKPSLQQIRNVLNMFAEADARQGGGHGRQALAEYLRTTVLPMLRAETDEQVRRALFDLAGEQAQLLGWMSYDSAEYGLSERYLLQSLRFSEDARNPILGAHALATLSHLATTLGHADEGVQLAKTGQAALRGASNAMFADLAVLESRSQAMLGDARAAAHAVHSAERALRNVVTADEPPEMRFIDHAYIAGEIANTLVLLGDIPRAVDFAQQSIESSLSQGRARRGALSNIALARAHLARRDVDSACAAGAEALRLGQEVDSARTTRALKSLKRRLGAHTSARPALALVEEMDEAAI